ncbi:hypothetical protein ACXR0O_25135 [Verrucomicrobiota bacterium sgz303538]
MADELGQQGGEYIRAWRHVLSGWLTWPEDHIQKFIAVWRDDMRALDTLFYSELPNVYVVPFLIPDTLRRELGDDVIKLENRLHAAIGFSPDFITRPEKFMWGSAQKCVLAILKEYGTALPNFDDPFVSRYLRLCKA